MRKKLLFVFSIISLVGLVAGLAEGEGGYGGAFNFVAFFQAWILFSLPLIIQLIYILIFRER